MKKSPKEKLLKLAINPFIIALPFAVFTFWLLSGSFNKYTAERIDKIRIPDNVKQICIKDINGDGYSERIEFFDNNRGKAALKILLHDGSTVDQWNMNGFYLTRQLCEVIDVNGDGNKEIVMLYARSDSLFMAIFNPVKPETFYREDIFIERILITGKPDDYSFSGVLKADINGDEQSEIMFTMTAGFGLQPRNLYAYDVANDTVLSSDYLSVHAKIENEHSVVDLDGDGSKEILLRNFATGNMRNYNPRSMHDHAAWIIILDNKLQFWTPPVPLNATPATISPHVFDDDGKKSVLFFFKNQSPSGDSSRLILFDPLQRKIVSEQIISGFRQMEIIESKCNASNAVFYNEHGEWFSVDHQLEIEPGGRFPNFTQNSIFEEVDLDDDGKYEMLFYDREYMGFWILRNTFRHPVFISVPEEAGKTLQKVMVLRRTGQPNAVVLQLENFLYVFSYGPNVSFWLKWPLMLLAYLFFAGLFYIILHFHKKQVNKKYIRTAHLAELKLKSIRNQMDPHFTFNAVNAIASAFYKEDKKVAYSYFTKFSKLVRATMLYSDRITRLLEDEINFTIEYLDIEKFRFRKKFDYSVHIDEDVELSAEVPRMIIQSYAEAAVSNGLMHRDSEYGGLLTIRITEADSHLEFQITDNGVGIEKSKKYNKEKAFKSVRIMDEFISLINELNTSKITVKMFDNKVNGAVTGTEVNIRIPFNLKYKLT
jgi:hypothetical protein